MSLITRCPACGTMFKVVPDQLRISEGWVRCGHCSEVFDASAHMQQEPTEPPAPVAQVPVVAAERPAPMDLTFSIEVPTRMEVLGPPPFDAGAGRQLAPTPIPTPLPTPAPKLASTPTSRSAEAPAAPSPVGQAIDVLGDDAMPDYALAVESLSKAHRAESSRSDAADTALSGANTTADEPALEEVSFVQQARRQAFWRRPLVRVSLWLFAVMLIGLLTAQVAVQERDRLAALEPAFKPWLNALCEPLACSVGPVRQIDAIVIDSSSFAKLRGDTYRLSLGLKNQATGAVALPAIELTLTDSQDQPLLRRVLLPAQLDAKTAAIEAGSEWSSVVTLGVATTGGTRVAGYRVLAFYP